MGFFYEEFMTFEQLKKYNIDNTTVMKRVVRHMDIITNNIDAKTPGAVAKNKEGFIVGSAPVAKVGIMNYLMGDGTVLRELVTEETLFDEDSMASLKMRPVTNDHPYEKKITSDNYWRAVGTTGETITKDGKFLVASFVIMDKNCIDLVDEGKQELSPGYECELAMQPGVFDGQEYDAVQIRRSYNHLAVVDSARGGKDIRMNKMDGAEIDTTMIEIKPQNKEISVIKFKIDGIDYDASQEVVNLLTKVQGDLKISNDSVQVITAERDVLKVKVDGLEKRDIQKEVNDAVQARLYLERVGKTCLDSIDEKLTNRQLTLAIIEKKQPEVFKKIGNDTSDIYLNAVLDTIVAAIPATQLDNAAAQRAILDAKTGNNDGTNVDSVEESRKKFMEKRANAYKNKDKKAC